MVLLGAGQQCDDILVMQRAQLPQDLDFLAEQTLRFGEAFLRDAFDRNGEMFLKVGNEKKGRNIGKVRISIHAEYRETIKTRFFGLRYRFIQNSLTTPPSSLMCITLGL